MKTLHNITKHATFRYVDHTKEMTFQDRPYTAATSFAIDDAIATAVSQHTAPPTMRLWVHPHTVVLGIPDTRVPYLNEGIKFLNDAGYHVIVRNSGGLAVVLDEGILNISLILPNMGRISIYDSYEAMVTFVQHMLKDVTRDIEAYEIVGSYCPGDYDLSINGRKFAGISQRRIKDAAAIQIYLDVNGNSKRRAQLIRDFYRIAIKGKETKFTYPHVEPNKMASLTELIGRTVTVDEMVLRATSTLQGLSEELVKGDLSAGEMETFKYRMNMMEKRNEKIQEILNDKV